MTNFAAVTGALALMGMGSALSVEDIQREREATALTIKETLRYRQTSEAAKEQSYVQHPACLLGRSKPRGLGRRARLKTRRKGS